MAVVMDGDALAKTLKKEIQKRVDKLRGTGTIPSLATILIGDEPSSKTYVQMKEKDCKEVGILFKTYNFGANVPKNEIFQLIDKLNADKRVQGILIQLPLPPNLNETEIISRLFPEKDVDGLCPYNVGKLWLGMYNFDQGLLPCTPKGIMKILDHYNIELAGKNVMKLFDEVFFPTTFGGEALSLAAALATIKEIKEKNIIKHLWKQGRKLKDGYNRIAKELGLSTEIVGYPPKTILAFKGSTGENSLEMKSLLFQEVAKRGVLLGNVIHISYSHTDEDIEKTLNVCEDSLRILKRAIGSNKVKELLEGEISREVFRRHQV